MNIHVRANPLFLYSHICYLRPEKAKAQRDTNALLDEVLPVSGDPPGLRKTFTRVPGGSDAQFGRQLLAKLGWGRGHRSFVGTPEQIADTMEQWFDAGAADGFNIMPPALPVDLATFVEHVIPELRSRRLFRTEYAGTTLRDHYGLERPPSQYARRELAGAA